MKRWNDIELDVARGMIFSGDSYEVIGMALERTPRSVSSMLNKHGYSLAELKRKTVKCRVCKVEFTTGAVSRKYTCSDECYSEFITWNKKGPKFKSDHKTCKTCGRVIQGRRVNVFCGNSCSSLHKRYRIFDEIESGILYPTKMMKKYLIHKHGNCCMKCGWKEVNETSGIVPVQLDHIDGNSDNNSLTNIRLLCPNCHSLTPTYGSLNKNGSNSKKNIMKLEYYYKNKTNREVA